MTDYDTTEKLERTDVGFRLSVESTRGTGTRDEDKVKAELRTEEPPTIDRALRMASNVQDVMTDLRAHQPDEDGDD